MKKTILFLIALFVLISCAKKEEQPDDNMAHYKKAQEYYAKCLYSEPDLPSNSMKVEWCKRALGELDLAVFETTGDSREKVMDMIDVCNEKVNLLEGQQEHHDMYGYEVYPVETMSHKSTWSREDIMDSSTQNKAIEDSRQEIERKRAEYDFH